MSKRPIIYSMEQGRSYDFLKACRYMMESDARILADTLGSTATLASGFAATQTATASLTINVANGSVYQQSAVDGTAYGAIASDTRLIEQMGRYEAGTLTLTTSGLTSGQSQWALVQATFEQVDSIPADDPNAGVLPYYNSTNPSQPFQGPDNTGASQNTLRTGAAVLQVVYGGAATTGSEVPPSPSAGYVPLYLIDLTYGQTQITTSEILVAGPSVGTGVPSNYTRAPFIAGLLNSHHDGNIGQAPKIQLGNAQEVQGILPLANLPATNTVGSLPTIRNNAGNPNGAVAGALDDLVWDSTDELLYICSTAGTALTAVWTLFGYGALGSYKTAVNLTGTNTLIASNAGEFIDWDGNGTLTLPDAGAVPPGTVIAVKKYSGADSGTFGTQNSNVIVFPDSTPVSSWAIGFNTGFVVFIALDSTQWGAACGDLVLQYSVYFAKSFTANGYQILPSGLMVQWGSVTTNSSGAGTFTFPVAFPNAFMGAVCNSVGNGLVFSGISSGATTSACGVTTTQYTGAGTPAPVYVIAWGY